VSLTAKYLSSSPFVLLYVCAHLFYPMCRSEERSLELTVVMYSTKHLRLLEQTRVSDVLCSALFYFLLISSLSSLGHIVMVCACDHMCM
jgi:hypothetical protein